MMDEKQASLVLSVDTARYEYATRFRPIGVMSCKGSSDSRVAPT
jgi:hypothetical protein